MKCPACGEKTRVVDTRSPDDKVRRRRECVKCQHRFSTVEMSSDPRLELLAAKKSQSRRISAITDDLRDAIGILEEI